MSGLGSDDNSPDMTRGPALLAVSVTTAIVALSTCALRFCVKFRISRSVVWDDYFIGLAMVLGFVGTCFTIVESTSQDTLSKALQFDYLSEPWLNMGATLSKVSICLFFLRLVSRIKMWKIFLSVEIVLLILVNLIYIFTTLLQCRPMEKLWDSSVEGQCWSVAVQHSIGYFQGAFDVFSGLFIAFFPIMIIQDLNISRGLRWPFYTLSIMSLLIVMLSVVRTYNISFTESNEQYGYQIICTILAVLEQNLGILAANIIPMASLFSKNIRPISQALSQAASARDHSDTRSIMSKASKKSKSSRRQSTGSDFVIEGPQRASYDGNSIHSVDGHEAWPMGIIKTISVEVIQEQRVSSDKTMDVSVTKHSNGSRENWDSYLP